MPARKKRSTKTKWRTGARKTAARRRPTAKRKTAKRKSTGTGVRTPYKKSQLTTHIAGATNLSKKEVSAVLDELADVMHRHLRKGAAGEFTLPGLVKCTVKRKPATKARKGINPFTGEMMTFKAKPARNVVKVRALKRLKEMVE
ncbi:integration host factor [Coxiella burnetii]|nr:integration host factor [Coxiella burnetii]AML54358.1 integration host factor [Coxiella burnetii]ATN68322.1 integration host factor [Coxiella burnetii]ATN70253.1 integration host factor [Coxiella burnetii]ATN72192.1 integration host factor [Coxiella burnetii]